MAITRSIIFLVVIVGRTSMAQETEEATVSYDTTTNAEFPADITSSENTLTNINATTSVTHPTTITTTTSEASDSTTTTEGEDIVITTSWEPFDNVSMATESTTLTSSEATSKLTEEPTTSSAIAGTTCGINVCFNGGSCVLTATGEFKCICESGFVGELCQTRDFCDTNGEGLLCGDGACVSNEYLTFRRCKCFAGKYWNSKNKDCEEVKKPCFPNPCKNGGVCEEDTFGSYKCTCTDGYTGANCLGLDLCTRDADGTLCANGECIVDSGLKLQFCKCNEGYYRNQITNTCEIVEAPCKPDPCNGHGQCQVIVSNEYNCSCDSSYFGKDCEFLDQCLSDADGQRCANGSCILQKDNFTQLCVCNPGFYLEKHSGQCKLIQMPCVPNPCANNGVCDVVSSEEYTCTCADGFMGEECKVRDRCKLDGGDNFCQDAHCAMDSDRNTFLCQCQDDYYFDYHQRKCIVRDLCPLMICGENEICSNSQCECKTGYRRNNESKCERNFCSSYGCPGLNMLCEENLASPKDFRCFCAKGQAFNGTGCIDAVCSFPSLNHCSQKCNPRDGSYNCSCEEPSTLNEDQISCNISEDSLCVNSTCGVGICIKETDVDRCICPSGYIEIEGKCVDVCKANKLPTGLCPNDACVSDSNLGFRCACPKKYQQSSDGVTCIPTNPCAVGGTGLQICRSRNAHCVRDFNNTEGYYCLCSSGQSPTTDGTCRDICDFEEHQKECSQKGAICVVRTDKKESFSCKCPPSFTMGPSGICNKLVDFSFTVSLPLDVTTYSKLEKTSRTTQSNTGIDYDLITEDMEKSLERFFGGLLSLNVLICKNMKDFILCKAEVQLRHLAFGESFNRLLMPSSFYENSSLANEIALLPPSLLLRADKIKSYAAFQKTDPCDEDIMDEVCGPDTTCSSTEDGFTCTCKPGFLPRLKTYPTNSTSTFIETCRDIDECIEVDDPCPPTSKCSNTLGSYQCLCLPGFRENNRTTSVQCVALCNPNPCVHGQCEASGDHTFECRCEAGYSGALCNFEDKNYKGARINTVIVGVVLGGILLITVILFVASVSRLRKQKYSESSGQILYNTEMSEQRSVVLSAANPAFDRD